jgi:ATP-binding cassette subfamily C protein
LTILPVATPARARRWIGAELNRRRAALLATVAVGVLAAGVSTVPIYLLGTLVDRVQDRDTTGLTAMAAVIAATALCGGIATGVSVYLVNRLGEHLLADLREGVVEHALRLPVIVIEESGRGDLLSRVGADAAAIRTAVSDVLPTMVNGILLGVVTLAGIGTMDWRLGLAGALAIPAYVIGLRWYLPRSAPLYAQDRIAVAEHAKVTVESLQLAPTVLAYGAQDARVTAIASASARVRDLWIRLFTLFTRLVGRVNRAELIGLSAILVVAFLLVRADAITVGQTTAAALLFHRLFNPVGMVMYNFDEIQAATASLARLVGVLDTPVSASPGPHSEPSGAALAVEDVSFSYDGESPTLQGISFTVPDGGSLALVGSTGAGKSTLAAVVAGLLPPTSGRALVGGVPAAGLAPEQRSRTLVVLTQEVHVFSGTVLDDLRLAVPTASLADAVAALRTVGADEWVDALPDGIDTVVGELGHPLTAAQAQHLAFARLVLADPSVVVLDEATAEAGSSHARELDRAAVAATLGRTTVIVAHRLSQAAQADAIAVMDGGRIVEYGGHDELIAAGGRYARFWDAWRPPAESRD